MQDGRDKENTTDITETTTKNTADGHKEQLIDPSAAALYLANTYGNLLIERDNINTWLDGNQVFTEEMAIEELMSITAPTDKEAVQTSTLSNQTAMIAEKLACGYVEKRQRQLEREAEHLVEHLGYVEWKIGVIDEAMHTRMTRTEVGLFRLMFVKGRTYKQLRKAYKGKRIYDHDISRMKKSVLEAISDELRQRLCSDFFQKEYLKMLAGELKAEETRNAQK